MHEENYMNAVIISSFGNAADSLKLVTNRVKPVPKPRDILVKVKAASINPIDVRMRGGYGKNIFVPKAPLPWVLGRDFSGVVVDVGTQANGFSLGDDVFGVLSPFQPFSLENGSHAEYVCVSESDLTKMPPNVNYTEASSLPYVALTTYTALITASNIEENEYFGKHVFIQAGAGGVGSYAIQFLKVLGATISTTCSAKNIDFVKSLGADFAIDYNKQNYTALIREADVVFDLLGKEHTQCSISTLKSTLANNNLQKKIDEIYHDALICLAKMSPNSEISEYKSILTKFDKEAVQLFQKFTSTYISVVGPLMPLTDKHGFQLGVREYIEQALKEKAKQAKLGRSFNYSVFQPNKKALDLLADQVSKGLINPNIRKTFPLADAVAAHVEMEKGHGCGKLVFVM